MANLARLYLDQPLAEGQTLTLERDQAHYLFGVMRLTQGAALLVFNGRDGEWHCTVSEAAKRGGVLTAVHQTKPQSPLPDLWLLFAPIKKARTDFIVEKATELGVSRILPVQTEFTNSERIRRDRLQAHAVEAAEQCGGTAVPQVAELCKLPALLDQWPQDRALMFCDESAAGAPVALSGPAGPWAIVIGPEGGFSEPERSRLRAMDAAHPVSLGPRILRADTAAVAALTLWHITHGNWR